MEKKNKAVNQVLLDYSEKIQKIIDQNNFEDLSEGLIMDWITKLYSSENNFQERDAESDVYMFYAYYDKYAKYLELNGEESFLNLIIEVENQKSIDSEDDN